MPRSGHAERGMPSLPHGTSVPFGVLLALLCEPEQPRCPANYDCGDAHAHPQEHGHKKPDGQARNESRRQVGSGSRPGRRAFRLRRHEQTLSANSRLRNHPSCRSRYACGSFEKG